MLCLDESGEAAPGAFAKLAIAELIGESFEVRHSVNRKIFEFGVGRVEVQRCLPEDAAADGLPQLEMIDAEQFERFLDLGEQPAFELDSLRGDAVVDAPAPGEEREANQG